MWSLQIVTQPANPHRVSYSFQSIANHGGIRTICCLYHNFDYLEYIIGKAGILPCTVTGFTEHLLIHCTEII